MKKTKGFSYDTEMDMDVIEHIEKQPLQNKYILDLVRKDMSKSENDIEGIVRRYVEKILKDKNIKVEDVKRIELDSVMDLLSVGIK